MSTHNIFNELLAKSHDEDFTPACTIGPTSAEPGSYEKIEVLAGRAARGEELWHDDDPVVDFAGIGHQRYVLSREEAVPQWFGPKRPSE